MLIFRNAVIAFLCSCILSACGGGGNSSPLAPQAASLPANESVVVLTSSGSTVALQAVGGYSGSVSFPAISAPASVVLESSTHAPAGFTLSTSANRRLQSGTLSEFFFVNVTPQKTIAFPTLPSFTLRLPATFDASGKQFYYAISQPASAGVYAQYRTEGPGNVSGTSVEFDATANPLTLVAGTKYTFAFYAVSTNNTSADKLLYVANQTSITAYPLTAQGNVAPVRTLQGPATGLTAPVAVTTDSAGNLFVANSIIVPVGPPGEFDYSTRVEVFAEGASGNTAPIRTFDLSDIGSNYPTAIAVDSAGRIYIVADRFNLAVSVFSPTGTLLKLLPQATLQYPANNGVFFNGGLSIDKRQNLIVSGDDCGPENCVDLSFVLPANATSTTAPLYSLAPFIDQSTDAVAYAKDADLLFTLSRSGTILFDQQNAANAPILRRTTVSTQPDVWRSVAVDTTGKYAFLAGANANAILPLVGNASVFVPGTPISGSNTGLNFPLALTVGPP